MGVFEERLRNDLQAAQALSAGGGFSITESPHAAGQPANRWIVQYAAPTIVSDAAGIRRVESFVVHFQFPPDYLRRVESAAHVVTVLTQQVFHPNVRGPLVCMHIEPGMPLSTLIHGVYEILTWQRPNPAHPLNETASQWYRAHLSMFPLTTRSLWGQAAPSFQVREVTEGAT